MDQRRIPQTSNRRRFGAAHATRSLGWSVVDLLLAWHIHATLGLTGMQTGWVLFAFLALGGTVTVAVGIALSRHGATGDMVVRVQLPATVAASILLVLQFQVRGAVAFVVAGLLFRIAYAVQDVTQNMLSSLLPTDEVDIVRYARLRVMLSAVTRCGVMFGFAMLIPDGIGGMLVVIALTMIAAALALRGLVFPVRSGIPAARRGVQATVDGMPSLLAAWVVAAMVLPTVQRLLIFAPATGGSSGVGAWLLGGCCAGSVIGPMFRQRIDGRVVAALIVGSGLTIVMPASFAPPPASGGDWWRFAGAVVHGMALSLIGVRLWATTSRVAMNDTRGRDGLVFGSVILAIHLSSAVGMLVLGPLIEGFEAGRPEAQAIALTLTALGALLLGRAGAGPASRFAVDDIMPDPTTLIWRHDGKPAVADHAGGGPRGTREFR